MAKAPLIGTVAALSAGIVGVSLVKIVFSFLPAAVTTVFVCLLSPASLFALRGFGSGEVGTGRGVSCAPGDRGGRSEAENPSPEPQVSYPPRVGEPAPWFTRDALFSLVTSGVSVSFFLLLWSMLNMGLKVSSGHYGYGAAASPELVVIAQLIDIAFAATLAIWVARRGGTIGFNSLWRAAFVCLAATMVSVAFLGLSQVAQVFTSAAYEMADGIVWLTIVDLVRHCVREGDDAVNENVLCGIGFLLLIRLPDSLGRILVNACEVDVFSEASLIAVMFAVIVVVAFLLPHRSPGAQLLFMELGRCAPAEATPSLDEEDTEATLSRRCENLAKTSGLSARELQIVKYLCCGRSKQYIAETLYLSENTVRTYTRRIYAKLEIHSRQELQNLLGME